MYLSNSTLWPTFTTALIDALSGFDDTVADIGEDVSYCYSQDHCVRPVKFGKRLKSEAGFSFTLKMCETEGHPDYGYVEIDMVSLVHFHQLRDREQQERLAAWTAQLRDDRPYGHALDMAVAGR